MRMVHLPKLTILDKKNFDPRFAALIFPIHESEKKKYIDLARSC